MAELIKMNDKVMSLLLLFEHGR